MHGLVSLLPQPYYNQVTALWDELESSFGLKGIRVTPFPHFSWEIASEYDEPLLAQLLNHMASSLPPLAVTATGLGIFSGPQPVIFIPLVKNESLVQLHQTVWNTLTPAARDRSPYYHPDCWVPHISLAYMDVTPANIGPVMEKLAFRSINWQFAVDNFAYIYEPEGTIGQIKIQAVWAGK